MRCGTESALVSQKLGQPSVLCEHIGTDLPKQYAIFFPCSSSSPVLRPLQAFQGNTITNTRTRSSLPSPRDPRNALTASSARRRHSCGRRRHTGLDPSTPAARATITRSSLSAAAVAVAVAAAASVVDSAELSSDLAEASSSYFEELSVRFFCGGNGTLTGHAGSFRYCGAKRCRCKYIQGAERYFMGLSSDRTGIRPG